jgi:hypothetical protein
LGSFASTNQKSEFSPRFGHSGISQLAVKQMRAQKSSGIIVNWIAEQILTEGTLKPRPLIGPIEQSRSHTNESQIGSYRKRIHLGPEIARAWKPSPIRDQNESSMTSKSQVFPQTARDMIHAALKES